MAKQKSDDKKSKNTSKKQSNNKKQVQKITTIKINKGTKLRLDRLKEHERESYEQVLRKILFILNLSKKDPEKAQRIFKKIDSVIKRKEKYTEVDQE
jgi:hypothetical protein